MKWIAITGILFCLMACSSGPKRQNKQLELSDVFGSKVALVEIKADSSLEKKIRSALLEQLLSQGTFVLLSNYAVKDAQMSVGENPNPKAVAVRVGADYMMRIELLNLSSSDGIVEMKLEFTQLIGQQKTFSKVAKALDKSQPKETQAHFFDRILKKAFSDFFTQFINNNQTD